MGLEAFNTGCNVVAIVKNGKKYGMCCSWGMMVDYEKVMLLLGAQSITGNILKVNDIVGVSALADGQKDIAFALGEGHSDKVDKFQNVAFHLDDTAILIDGARVTMKCRVNDILHLPGIEKDNCLVLDVISFSQNKKIDFLDGSKVW